MTWPMAATNLGVGGCPRYSKMFMYFGCAFLVTQSTYEWRDDKKIENMLPGPKKKGWLVKNASHEADSIFDMAYQRLNFLNCSGIYRK